MSLDDARTFLESVAGYTDQPQAEVPSQDRPVKLGTVDAAYTGSGNPKVLFDGETVMGVRTYPWVGRRPRPLDRVVLVPQGHTYVVMGTIGTPPGADYPVGTSIEGYWAAAPTGFLLENGAVYLRADYPDLFAVVGTTYNTGGETGAQFRVPDSTNRAQVGKGSGTFATLGAKVGAETVAHTHGLTAAIAAWFTGYYKNRTVGANWTATNTHTAGVGGGSSAVTNNGIALDGLTDSASPSVVQPSIVVNRAIKF